MNRSDGIFWSIVALAGAYVLTSGDGAPLGSILKAGGPFGAGIGGTVGQPAAGGGVVNGKDWPKDTPANRLTDQFLLVTGNMNVAKLALNYNPFSVSPVEQFETIDSSDSVLAVVSKMYDEVFYDLDASFVPLTMGVCRTENSSFDPNRERFESSVNDYSVGLMQIRTATADWLSGVFRGKSQDEIRSLLKDPYTNIGVGMQYLAYQVKRYSDSTLKLPRHPYYFAAAAYNAGSALYNFQRNVFSNQSYPDSVISQSGLEL